MNPPQALLAVSPAGGLPDAAGEFLRFFIGDELQNKPRPRLGADGGAGGNYLFQLDIPVVAAVADPGRGRLPHFELHLPSGDLLDADIGGEPL